MAEVSYLDTYWAAFVMDILPVMSIHITFPLSVTYPMLSSTVAVFHSHLFSSWKENTCAGSAQSKHLALTHLAHRVAAQQGTVTGERGRCIRVFQWGIIDGPRFLL